MLQFRLLPYCFDSVVGIGLEKGLGQSHKDDTDDYPENFLLGASNNCESHRNSQISRLPYYLSHNSLFTAEVVEYRGLGLVVMPFLSYHHCFRAQEKSQLRPKKIPVLPVGGW